MVDEKSIQLCIGIATHKRPKELARLLDCLSSQGRSDFTVICFNDGADPSSQDVCQREYPFPVHHLSQKNRQGVVFSRNAILSYIQEQKYEKEIWVTFLDDDVMLASDFVTQVVYHTAYYDGFTFHLDQRGESTTLDLIKYPRLHKFLTPWIGTVNPWIGIVFGGFYIQTGDIHKTSHMPGGCLNYNFSKAQHIRFDPTFERGNAALEDTEFSYHLSQQGFALRFISTHTFIHAPALTGGFRAVCREKFERFSWYWCHKFSLAKRSHGKLGQASCQLFSIPECLIYSLVTRRNLFPQLLQGWRNAI